MYTCYTRTSDELDILKKVGSGVVETAMDSGAPRQWQFSHTNINILGIRTHYVSICHMYMYNQRCTLHVLCIYYNNIIRNMSTKVWSGTCTLDKTAKSSAEHVHTARCPVYILLYRWSSGWPHYKYSWRPLPMLYLSMHSQTVKGPVWSVGVADKNVWVCDKRSEDRFSLILTSTFGMIQASIAYESTNKTEQCIITLRELWITIMHAHG